MQQLIFLLQSSNLPNVYMLDTLNIWKTMNYQYKEFGLIPFTNIITNIENILDINNQYIIKGGTKILNILNTVNDLGEISENLTKEQIKNKTLLLKNLKNGIDYDIKKFDQNYYQNFNLPLLNNKAEYFKCKDIINHSFKIEKFIKPSKDLKFFNGGILEKNETIKNFIEKSFPQEGYLEETILISDYIHIKEEYRFFVIQDQIITGSLYRKNNKFQSNENIPMKVLEVAKEYAKLYQPEDIYVMDIAKLDNDFKIIEYNCWNTSGYYESNLMKLYSEIYHFKSYTKK